MFPSPLAKTRMKAVAFLSIGLLVVVSAMIGPGLRLFPLVVPLDARIILHSGA